MKLSTRYAAPLIVVLGLALVPTIIHSYAAVTLDDGVRARDLDVQVDGVRGTDTSRKAAWVERRLSSVDWQEKRYVIEGREVVLFIGRSYDPKALYHHPELALAYGMALAGEGLTDLRGVPAHALRGRGQPIVAMYALHADGGFVDDPVGFQIRNAATALWRGRTPMTLFFALERDSGPAANLGVTGAARVLEAGIKTFLDAGR